MSDIFEENLESKNVKFCNDCEDDLYFFLTDKRVVQIKKRDLEQYFEDMNRTEDISQQSYTCSEDSSLNSSYYQRIE